MKMLLTVAILLVCYSIESYALSKDDVKIYPEQQQVCDAMSDMAYQIQLERRLNNYEVFPPSENANLNSVAEWVYAEFTTIMPPTEVKHKVNSQCTAEFQKYNEGAYDV